MTVYFATSLMCTNCPIKIGYTGGEPDDRLEALQTGSPLKLELMGTIEDAAASKEKELHKRFREERLYGEWFAPSPRLQAYLCDQFRNDLVKRIQEVTNDISLLTSYAEELGWNEEEVQEEAARLLAEIVG